MNDKRSEELAAITPAQVTEFVQRIVDWGPRRGPPKESLLIFPIAKARALGLAKRHLDSMVSWKPDAPRAVTLGSMVAMLDEVIKGAVVDKAADEVSFWMTGEELALLRQSVPYLVEYEAIKEMDARDGGGRNKKRR